jgi:hypothetical protein
MGDDATGFETVGLAREGRNGDGGGGKVLGEEGGEGVVAVGVHPFEHASDFWVPLDAGKFFELGKGGSAVGEELEGGMLEAGEGDFLIVDAG